jgi:peptidoglycan/LPS O-acetylase OafA/YrhL
MGNKVAGMNQSNATLRAAPDTPLTLRTGVDYNVAAGYLRTFVVVLVLAHHSVLAYHPFAPPPPGSLNAEPRWWQAFPVVDDQRWSGFAVFVGFNDVFFMSLLFFLSGLFVHSSLKRKGVGTFLKDRLIKLGIPFMIAAGLIAPLAYYPAYLQTGASLSATGFMEQWLNLDAWPAGPAWFIWVLLVFDAAVALLFLRKPDWAELAGRPAACASRHPFAFFAILVNISAAAYVPMAVAFDPLRWSSFGPFTFQTSRIFHYLVYFLIGVVAGAGGPSRGLLAPDGNLARRWLAWTGWALGIFGVSMVVTVVAMTSAAGSQLWAVLAAVCFVISCAATGFACLSLFVRFARSRTGLLDSLSRNSYGMYLIHYALMTWLQYALLSAELPAVVKACIVFVGTVLLSWGAIAGLRHVPAIGRVI